VLEGSVVSVKWVADPGVSVMVPALAGVSPEPPLKLSV